MSYFWGSLHFWGSLQLPQNIILIPIPPYSPELNPAEKMWQWFKSKISMKIYKSLDDLEDKIIQTIKNLENQKIKSITSFQYLANSYYSIFN